jgi:FHA domain
MDGMFRDGESRKRLAQKLTAAYADGLLSEETFADRMDVALGPGVVDPWRLIGDLSPRSTRPRWVAVRHRALERIRRWLGRSSSDDDDGCLLLALDWTGNTDDLTIGRDCSSDVVLPAGTVSRRHARILFRDGNWILQDLESTNGTLLNGVRVGRCRLRPGDRIRLGTEELRID